MALYGLIEIIKTIYYTVTYTNLKAKGIYIIIGVKNEEEKIEGFIRSSLFRIIYGKEDIVKNVIIVDLDSTDNTNKILDKMKSDYNEIKVTNWRQCKELIDSINQT